MQKLQVVRKEIILGRELRVFGDIENPLFLAKDIADWIDHSHITKMLEIVGGKDVCTSSTVVDSIGRNQEMKLLTEKQVYRILMRSDKPIAMDIQDGIFEFLKAWRKGEVKVIEVRDPMEIIQEALALATSEVIRIRAEKELLAIKLDEDSKWHSIKRVAKRHEMSWKDFNWRLLKAESIKQGHGVKKIFDANYEEVNSYHVDVWEVVYPEIEL
ncbi:MAG: BRO-N domain-containing protein [Fusobacteriaceae bacterium]